MTVAFPWVYFLIYMVDGELYDLANYGDHGICGISIFYRQQKLQTESDRLFHSNLTATTAEMPFGTCLGSGRPPVKTKNPNWCDILLEWFWGSNFYYVEGHFLSRLWDKTIQKIPEISSTGNWVELSKRKDWVRAICQLPWLECDLRLDQVVSESLDFFVEYKEGKREKNDPARVDVQINEREKNRLIAQFQEHLEEKIAFLGGHFSVSDSSMKTVKTLLTQRFSEVVEKLKLKFREHCSAMAAKVSRTVIK